MSSLSWTFSDKAEYNLVDRSFIYKPTLYRKEWVSFAHSFYFFFDNLTLL
nr:MAG TPA_asm: hypothetical protein [Bacteriophage sp.]